MAISVSTQTRQRIAALEHAKLIGTEQARSMRRLEGIWWVGVLRLAHQTSIPVTELVNLDLVDCRAQNRHDRTGGIMLEVVSPDIEEWWVQQCPLCQTVIREKHGLPDHMIPLRTVYLHSNEYAQSLANRLAANEFRPTWRYRQLRAQLADLEMRSPTRLRVASPA